MALIRGNQGESLVCASIRTNRFCVCKGLSIWLIRMFQTDMYAFPFVFDPSGFAFAIAFTLACVAVAAMVVRSNLDKLDMIAVLKARD